jgi:hypothetical protein
MPQGVPGHQGMPQGMVGHHGLPPIGGPVFGTLPSVINVQPGIPQGVASNGIPAGIPDNPLPADPRNPITVEATDATDAVTVADPAVAVEPGSDDTRPVVATDVAVPPTLVDQPQPAIDDVRAAAPNITVPDGMLGVVVANQTTRTLKVLAKFVDPDSGAWIARWNETVEPSQAVRLGVTTVGTFFLRADVTTPSGAVVPFLDGSDAIFNGPKGTLGLRRASVVRQGSDLVAAINE